MEKLLDSENISQKIRPIDFGVGFAWTKRETLLSLGLFVGLLNALLYYVAIEMRIISVEQAMFILPICNLFLTAFVLIFANSLAILQAQGKKINLFAIVKDSFAALPKITISLALIVATMFLGTTFMPLILIFLLWSPCFAVADFYIKQEIPKDDKEIDIFEELEALEAEEEKTFHASNIMFGLLRSISLSNSNFAITAYLVLFIFLILTLNFVLLMAADNSFNNPIMLCLLGVLGSISLTFISAIIAGCFMILLPKKARLELEIKDLSIMLKQKLNFNIQGSKKTIFIALFVLTLNLYLIYSFLVASKELPDNVNFQFISAEQDSDDLIVTLKVRDTEKHFAWLTQYAFSLTTNLQNDEVKPSHLVLLDTQEKQVNIAGNELSDLTFVFRFPFILAKQSLGASGDDVQKDLVPSLRSIKINFHNVYNPKQVSKVIAQGNI